MVQLAGNPHSSAENADVVEEARNAVLHHFNTDNRHYDLIFTSGATAGIKEWSGCARIDIVLLAGLLLSIVSGYSGEGGRSYIDSKLTLFLY